MAMSRPMAIDRTSRIVVAGAGSIGCYVGGCLALAGRDVTLLLRPALADSIGRHGLRISDLDGADRALPASALTAGHRPGRRARRGRDRARHRQERRHGGRWRG